MNYIKEKSVILSILMTNKGKVMSCSEIINKAYQYGMTESINAPRAAHSHPFWKALTSLKDDQIENLFFGKFKSVDKNGKSRRMFGYAYM